MTVRTFVIGSSFTTLVFWGIWLLIVFFLDPVAAGLVGYTLFFLSLFLAVASLTGLVGYGVRRLLNASLLPAYNVRNSLRQGVMLGLFLNILLLLIRARLYQWWVAVILIVLFISAELIFLSYDSSLKRRRYQTSSDRA